MVLLSGLDAKTPLGKIVQIRAERDSEIIKNFGEYEHKIRREWNQFKYGKMTKEEKDMLVKQSQNIFASLA